MELLSLGLFVKIRDGFEMYLQNLQVEKRHTKKSHTTSNTFRCLRQDKCSELRLYSQRKSYTKNSFGATNRVGRFFCARKKKSCFVALNLTFFLGAEGILPKTIAKIALKKTLTNLFWGRLEGTPESS